MNSKFGEIPKLNRLQKLELAMLGHAYIGNRKPYGFSGPVPVYIVKCTRHNILFLDTPHCYDLYFSCDLCLNEMFVERRRIKCLA